VRGPGATGAGAGGPVVSCCGRGWGGARAQGRARGGIPQHGVARAHGSCGGPSPPWGVGCGGSRGVLCGGGRPRARAAGEAGGHPQESGGPRGPREGSRSAAGGGNERHRQCFFGPALGFFEPCSSHSSMGFGVAIHRFASPPDCPTIISAPALSPHMILPCLLDGKRTRPDTSSAARAGTLCHPSHWPDERDPRHHFLNHDGFSSLRHRRPPDRAQMCSFFPPIRHEDTGTLLQARVRLLRRPFTSRLLRAL